MQSRFSAGVLVVLLVAAPALAAPGENSDFYLGANIGKSTVSSKNVDEDNDPTFGFAAGYQFNKNVGVEAFTRSLSFRIFDGLVGDSSYYPDTHYGISLLGAVPLNEQFSIYGRAGVGRTAMKSARVSKKDYKETDPSVGLGLSYALGRHWSFNLEAARFTKTDVTTVTAGAQFKL
ncbi:porin family protein [Massilia sp. NR 4-1]|uniref:porin family protein n=1 Tax=Massilia sp. NR 4-1 TaxID=1678028 RepID=UPI00067E5828|nr:porin family protein [Massilia sp. NR 4-1]AKU23543.1 hypothetical protein ACZ75_20930 [Massilia sp. NR 4-1]